MSVHETNEAELDDRTLLFRRALKKEARIVPDRQNLRGVTREELARVIRSFARSELKHMREARGKRTTGDDDSERRRIEEEMDLVLNPEFREEFKKAFKRELEKSTARK